MAKPKAIGIDLGTTNSCVAWVDDSGHSAMVSNLEGDLLTPSVVLFDDSEVVVGKDARTATLVNPERVAVWVKRDMGAPVYTRPIRGEYLPPEVIQACILRKLKADVMHALGPESQVVITVPAYFDEPRRKATSDAGEMAGLKVLDIVNEPTAGALAFGEVLGYLAPTGAPKKPITVLVYDLGGGTFDVTLLQFSDRNIRTLATDGDVQLGGYDWDLRVLNYVAREFQQAHGVDPREDAGAASRLISAVVEAKHTLSARSQATVRLDHAGHAFQCPLSRQKFEELTADLLERTAYTARQLLAVAKLQWSDVSRVMMVGGSTRMPMVARMLRQLSGVVPDHMVNPDEAVARGAALYAHFLLAQREPQPDGGRFEVTNVNAHSLGVQGIEPETHRKRNVILIPRNSALPAKATERFSTRSAGQRSIVVDVLEGESALPAECTTIGRTVLRDLPPGLPAGWPVDVTFEYGVNGRLTVTAVAPGTQQSVHLQLERLVGLTHDNLARWKAAVGAGQGFSQFEIALGGDLALRPSAAPLPTPMPLPTPAVPAPAPALPVLAATAPGRMPMLPLSAPTPLTGFDPQPLTPDAVWAETSRIPWKVINVGGIAVAVTMGIVVGYCLLAWMFPGRLPGLW